MKLKSINIRKVDLPNWKYGLYITKDDNTIISIPFSMNDFVMKKRGDEEDINFPDTIYKFLQEYSIIDEDDTEIETAELSFEIWDFNQHNFYIAFSNYNITFKVTWFCFLWFHNIKQFYLGKEHEFHSVILMFVHPMERIYCGTGKDIQVMATHWVNNLLLPNKVLEKSHIKISWDVKTLTLGEFGISELKKSTNKVVWTEELEIKLYWLKKLQFVIDSNISKLEIGKLKIENSIIEWWILKDCEIGKFIVEGTIFKDMKFYNVLFPKNKLDFVIYRSSFLNCVFSNVDWGNGISSSSWSNGEIKETYRMLKYEYESIWNKTEANKFFAKEMEYYEKSLTWKTDWDKKLISMIQRISNDYGNSWIRPLVGMACIIFLASIYSLIFWWYPNKDIHSLILGNILPISEIWDFKGFLDLGYKLTWTFLVYQFIVALRRISQR